MDNKGLDRLEKNIKWLENNKNNIGKISLEVCFKMAFEGVELTKEEAKEFSNSMSSALQKRKIFSEEH